MRAARVIGSIAGTAIAVLGSLGGAPSAHASNFGIELNGTYRVFSNGDWARTNEVKFKQQSVLETWTVSSTCVSPISCTGEVTSDQGWTAPLRLDSFYYVERTIPNWAPCPDGTFADGHQNYLLWGVDPATELTVAKNIQFMAGRNNTRTDSGACGVNKPVVIELPVSVTKLS